MTQTIPLDSTNSFSKTFLDYLAGDEKLKSFYGNSPAIENFSAQIVSKKFPIENRLTLVNALKTQYHTIELSSSTSINIDSLRKDTTFTITTGHQLSIFGGPLYFIYKIITTINAAKVLNEKFKDYHFVPVFWMASEDHDFEEINHFNLFGKTWKWDTEQKGAVGRFNTLGFDVLLNSLPEKIKLFEKAYLNHTSLADATRFFVNELFGQDGLVILDGDDIGLKKIFSPLVKKELLEKESFTLVNQTSEKLLSYGYDAQVHAREINLFFLSENGRDRIVYENDKFVINNTSLSFSKDELLDLVDKKPDKFSPNVILRPLYQEMILPNLAYIGGPAEVIYWLQLKSVFDLHQIVFPIVMPRNFGLYLTKSNQTKIDKSNLTIEDFFLAEDKLKKYFIEKIAGAEFKLTEEKEVLLHFFEKIKDKALLVDKTMEATVMAEAHKSIKILDELERKLKKAEERKHETSLLQIMHLKEKLFPNGGLQERTDNFLNFYINNLNFLNLVKGEFDPFHFEFYILKEYE